MIAEIERTHMERFRGLYDTMKDGHIFVKEEDTVWRCMECGHIYIGKKAPNRCPSASILRRFSKSSATGISRIRSVNP